MEPTAQNKNSMIARNPPIPLTIVLQKIPLAAVVAAFLVSSATCPEASNPMRIPAVARYERHQFHPGGAPVPLYVDMNACSAVLKPIVLAVPIGSQIILRKKSRSTKKEDI